MKKKRGVWILTAGAILLCGLLILYGLLKKQNSETEETDTQETTQEEVFSVDADEIQKLSFQAGDETLAWKKEGEDWLLEGDEDFPTDTEKIDSAISAITSLKSTRELSDIESLSEYGLEDPVNVIQIEKTDGTTETITVGDKSSATGNTYIYLNEDSETVYTISSDLGTTFSNGLYHYAEGEKYPNITVSTIGTIAVEKEKKSYTVVNNTESLTGWYVEDENGEKQEADATEAGTLQSTVAGLSFGGYYDYNCSDWDAYGLETPKMTVKIDYTEEVEEESTEEDSDESEADTDETQEEETTTKTVERQVILYVGNINETDGNYYVRLGDSQELHGISQNSLETLLNGKAFDYWKLDIDYIAVAALDHLDVEYQGTTYTLKRVVTEEVVESEDTEEDEETQADEDGEEQEETKTVTTYYVDDHEVDGSVFTQFYRTAVSMVCQSRLEEDPTKGDADLVLTYYGTDGEVVKISYTSRDSSFYLMKDQDGKCGLVNKMNVKDLIEDLLALVQTETE